MKCSPLIKEFQPVAILLAIIAFLDFADLGIVREVAGFWGGALGIHAGTAAQAMPAMLLEDSVCFDVMALVALLCSWVLPLGDALSRALAAIRAIKINPHVAYPVALALLAGAAWYARLHDTGIVRGMFILFMDNGVALLKRLVVSTHRIIPSAPAAATHAHPICPCDLNPFVRFPADAAALGILFVKVALLYSLELETAWQRRKRATGPLSAIQES